MAAPPNLAPSTGPNRGGKKDGDPVDLYTGLFVLQKTDIALPDVLPMALTRMYRPGDARSRAFGIGAAHAYDLFLLGDTFPYTYLRSLPHSSASPSPRWFSLYSDNSYFLVLSSQFSVLSSQFSVLSSRAFFITL